MQYKVDYKEMNQEDQFNVSYTLDRTVFDKVEKTKYLVLCIRQYLL